MELPGQDGLPDREGPRRRTRRRSRPSHELKARYGPGCQRAHGGPRSQRAETLV